MLLPAAIARSAIASLVALSLSCSPLQLAPAAAAAPPSAESQSALQKAFQSAQAGSYASADMQLGLNEPEPGKARDHFKFGYALQIGQ